MENIDRQQIDQIIQILKKGAIVEDNADGNVSCDLEMV